MNFWLAVNKPKNISSANLVYKIRKLLNIRKIGHNGTLDPFATGILALAVGEATKSSYYIMNQKKRYEFQVKFGIETETDDIEGKILKISDVIPSKEEIFDIMPNFIGDVKQIAPKFSAKKIHGQRAYRLARENKEFDLPICHINIEELNFIEYNEKNSIAKFTIHCSKGTYIRSIARDMGKLLGCYGHVISLERIGLGIIDKDSSVSIEKLEEIINNNMLHDYIIPINLLLADINAIKIDDMEILKVRNGCRVKLENLSDGLVRILDDKGLVAIGEMKDEIFFPKRIFNNYIS